MSRARREEYVLVLQGGGALGAYQAGVFEALAAEGIRLDWLSGISIGAINAALIAGTPLPERVERLREFWDLISAPLPEPPSAISEESWRALLNGASALRALFFGVPGFFTPRLPPAPLQPKGTLAAISFYDTAPLRRTLERLVDFARLNSGETRLSVGAVNVRTGNLVYFDSAKQKLDVRHIMASAALPPGFPPVEIDGEYYWDGGLVSNTPLNYVLDQPQRAHRTVFQVDLFPAQGRLPESLAEASEREKDIRYSSRTRLNTTRELDRHRAIQAIGRLLAKLPPELREDPDAQALGRLLPTRAALDIVHLIYRGKRYEQQSKDYEFSRRSMREHWASGRADMMQTLRHPRWIERGPADGEARVFDLVEAHGRRMSSEGAMR